MTKPSTQREASRPPGFDVLIAEDDASQADELSEFLSRCGYSVETASGGSEGLHRAAIRKLAPP